MPTGAGRGSPTYNTSASGLRVWLCPPPKDTTICGGIIDQDGKVLLERTTGGYHPSRLSLPERRRLREALARALRQRGLGLRLNAAYFVFAQGGVRQVYLLDDAHSGENMPAPDNVEAMADSDLNPLAFSTGHVADTMVRFALKAQSRNFGFYLGDGRRGDAQAPFERT
ncbi:MAG: hypothetical protein AAF636_04560 [Pseudomonadota bacterium]